MVVGGFFILAIMKRKSPTPKRRLFVGKIKELIKLNVNVEIFLSIYYRSSRASIVREIREIIIKKKNIKNLLP